MFKLYTTAILNKCAFLNNTDKKDVYLLGQGWYAKGFMDNINTRKYNVTNIYADTFTNTGQCIKHPEKKISFNYDMCVRKRTILDIDVQNQILFAKDWSLDFSNDIVVCGLGDNEPVKKWETPIDMSNQTFSVVGAGLVGTEIALKLADENKDVTIYDGLSVTHEFLPPTLKKLILNNFAKKNITLHTDRFYNNEPCDKVIFATGSKPNMLTKDWVQTENLQLEYDNKIYDNIYFGGNCVWKTQINDVGTPSAQLAYDQGKQTAISLNTKEKIKYSPKNFIYTMYVGDNYNAIYMNGYDTYFLVPTCFISMYYKYAYTNIL